MHLELGKLGFDDTFHCNSRRRRKRKKNNPGVGGGGFIIETQNERKNSFNPLVNLPQDMVSKIE